MATAPTKVNVQGRRVDNTILPNNFSQPYRLYVIQQNTDMQNIASGANDAGQMAYEATVKNEEQDVTLEDHEERIVQLRVEVDDHEIRITANTADIAALDLRVTTAEGQISVLQTDVAAIQDDYVSKSATTLQTLASPISVTTSYSVGGTKVVGARNTGWTASTGTASKAGINGSTTYAVSATYTQSEVQAIATGLQQVRQLAVALQTALGATSGHGLINA